MYLPEDGQKEETEKFYKNLKREDNKYNSEDLNTQVRNYSVDKAFELFREHLCDN